MSRLSSAASLMLSFAGVFWPAVLSSFGYWCRGPLITICHWLYTTAICLEYAIFPLPIPWPLMQLFSNLHLWPTLIISHIPFYIVSGSFNVQLVLYGHNFLHDLSFQIQDVFKLLPLSLMAVAKDICPGYCISITMLILQE